MERWVERVLSEKSSRRSFLKSIGAGAGIAALTSACESRASAHLPTRGRKLATSTTTVPPTSSTVLDNGMYLPTAAWVGAENSKPGTSQWIVAGHPVAHGIEGYASQVSAQVGDTVTLYVSTTEASFHVEAYRMGWYGGSGGRLVWVSPEVPGVRQPAPDFIASTRTVRCSWSPSMQVPVTAAWPPGTYLLKLVGSGGQQQWVPLCVRDDSSTAAYAVMNAVTTWQAYNLWGGYSLYYGQAGHGRDYAHRSLAVSFDRPYPLDWANGAADFIGNELPLILLMERHGLDVTYMTDVDLHARPDLVANHAALLSLGHDEYWSIPMRSAATAAQQAGVNLVFFGANACYRRIRLDASPLGPNRLQICYKTSYREDPMFGVDDAEVTANWPDYPAPDPESSLIGSMYQSNPVNAKLVVTEPSAWIYSGLDVIAGDSFASVVGTEYDRYDPSVPSPPNVEIFAHSPVECRGVADHSDVTWYTSPGGGGVLATGTNWWISRLTDAPGIPSALLPGPFPGATDALTAMTLNVLSVVGGGPAAGSHPSRPNWQQYYTVTRHSVASAGNQAA